MLRSPAHGLRRLLAVSTVVALATGSLCAATTGAEADGPRHGTGLVRSGPTVTPRAGLMTLQRRGIATPSLPSRVDLSRWSVPVGNQRWVNSCVPWAIAYGMLGWFSRRQGHAGRPYHPMYVYAQVAGGDDAGSTVGDVVRVLRTQGVPSVRDYDHSMTAWRHQPGPAETARAARNKGTGFVWLYATWSSSGPGYRSRQVLKTALAAGRPVALGIDVYRNFYDASRSHPLVRGRDAHGRSYGGHEVLAVGYSKKGVRIQNSWGTRWGNHGYATLDWSYLAHHSLDAATIAGFTTTTGGGRPVVASMSRHAGPRQQRVHVTVGGSRLGRALVTVGGRTVKPAWTATGGRSLGLTLPASLSTGDHQIRVSTPRGISRATHASAYRVAWPLVERLSPDHGPGTGVDTVTLTGRNLAGASLTVGGRHVPPISVTDRAITFRMPGRTGSWVVRVEVTRAGGTDAVSFTYDDVA